MYTFTSVYCPCYDLTTYVILRFHSSSLSSPLSLSSTSMCIDFTYLQKLQLPCWSFIFIFILDFLVYQFYLFTKTPNLAKLIYFFYTKSELWQLNTIGIKARHINCFYFKLMTTHFKGPSAEISLHYS